MYILQIVVFTYITVILTEVEKKLKDSITFNIG